MPHNRPRNLQARNFHVKFFKWTIEVSMSHATLQPKKWFTGPFKEGHTSAVIYAFEKWSILLLCLHHFYIFAYH